MISFVVGMCIFLEGAKYKIVEVRPNNYLLSQIVKVHGREREFEELWKKSWVDQNARKCNLKKGSN